MSVGYRALNVDDNDLNRALARTVLTRSTHPITAPDHPERGRHPGRGPHALATENVDLILLGMHLPDGHSTNPATELTTHADRPVIIVVTASVLVIIRQPAGP